MNQKRKQTEQMALYYNKGMTCREIGKLYGLTQQSVWQRFKRMGILRDTRAPRPETIDKNRLVNLYEVEKLALGEIAASFDVSVHVISHALKYYQIPKRAVLKNGGKHVDLFRKLNIGESVVIEYHGKHPRIALSNSAKACGIEISIQSLGNSQFKITRFDKNDAQNLPRHVRINKDRLEELYSEKKLPVNEISKLFGCSENTIRKALKFHKIPRRAPLENGGRLVDLLRSLRVDESTELECSVKYPVGNLHSIARRIGVKISVRRLGNSRFRITKFC